MPNLKPVADPHRAGPRNGAHEWNRTIDLLLTKEVLYRLSYVSGCTCAVLPDCEEQSCVRAALFNTAKNLETFQQFDGAGDGNRTRTISLEG